MADGNIAAMREALEAMLEECCNLCDVPNQMSESGHTCSWRNRWSGCQSKAIDKARAALSAPPRNCDRFVRLDDISMHDSPIDSTLVIATREEMLKFIRWLMAPAKSSNKKEGGAK